MGSYLLIYDVLSSGTTASLFETEGRLVSRAFHPHQVQFRDNYAWQNPGEWIEAVKRTTAQVTADISLGDIAAVSFTDQIQLCLCVDEAGEPLMDAITWSDTRAAELPDRIGESIPPEEYFHHTGQYNTPRSPLRKLHWIKEKQPELYGKTYCMLGCKEFLIQRMTGYFCLEYSTAAATGAFDIRALAWYGKALRCLGIDAGKLPQPVQATQVAGAVTARGAKEFGLREGIPVVVGAGDLTSSAVGAGASREGDAYMSVSSSSWLAIATANPICSTELSVENTVHAVDGLYLAFGNLQEISVTFKWLKNGILHYGESSETAVNPFKNYYPYDDMQAMAAKSSVGAGGVLYLPYLLGPGTAKYDPNPYGAFVGLKVGTTPQDLVRAGLEGATFLMKSYLELFRESYEIRQILATSAASKEEEWLQLMADIFDADIRNTNLTTTVDAIGAAIIAGAGIGRYPDVDQAERFWRYNKTLTPQGRNVSAYRNLYDLFCETSKVLSKVNARLAPQ